MSSGALMILNTFSPQYDCKIHRKSALSPPDGRLCDVLTIGTLTAARHRRLLAFLAAASAAHRAHPSLHIYAKRQHELARYLNSPPIRDNPSCSPCTNKPKFPRRPRTHNGTSYLPNRQPRPSISGTNRSSTSKVGGEESE